MGVALSPWVLHCVHGFCIVFMGIALSPWVLHCLHGYCIVSMVFVLSPWVLHCVHGFCLVSMGIALKYWDNPVKEKQLVKEVVVISGFMLEINKSCGCPFYNCLKYAVHKLTQRIMLCTVLSHQSARFLF